MQPLFVPPFMIDNALLVELAPRRVRLGSLLIGADGRIGEVRQGPGGVARMDAGGAVVLPGLVCAHTHLYSALARGMPGPAQAPQNFTQILERVWWRLDRALDAEAVEVSALVGAVEALKAGTTTVLDHHASPCAIEGSLDVVGGALEQVGLRGVLCYEVSERGGRDEALRGLAENARFLRAVRGGRRPLLRGLCGAHAAFTLGPEIAQGLGQVLADEDTALHIHLAEDLVDARKDGVPTVTWLEQRGLLRQGHAAGQAIPPVLAHGVHLSDPEAARLCELGAAVVHNPRSNLNNAVGYSRPWRIGRLCLGTDGIGGDMLAEAQTAFLMLQTERKAHGLGPAEVPDVLDTLAASHTLAGRIFADGGPRLGQIVPGAPADLVITDYVPPTPLVADGSNLLGHLLFGLSSRNVRHVVCAGRMVVQDRRVTGLDETELLARAREVAARLWLRMGS